MERIAAPRIHWPFDWSSIFPESSHALTRVTIVQSLAGISWQAGSKWRSYRNSHTATFVHVMNCVKSLLVVSWPDGKKAIPQNCPPGQEVFDQKVTGTIAGHQRVPDEKYPNCHQTIALSYSE